MLRSTIFLYLFVGFGSVPSLRCRVNASKGRCGLTTRCAGNLQRRAIERHAVIRMKRSSSISSRRKLFRSSSASGDASSALYRWMSSSCSLPGTVKAVPDTKIVFIRGAVENHFPVFVVDFDVFGMRQHRRRLFTAGLIGSDLGTLFLLVGQHPVEHLEPFPSDICLGLGEHVSQMLVGLHIALGGLERKRAQCGLNDRKRDRPILVLNPDLPVGFFDHQVTHTPQGLRPLVG